MATPTLALASSGISVLLDGQQLAFDVPPQIIGGRTMAPMRAIFEALGVEISWDGDNLEITAIKGETVINMQIDNPIMRVDGKEINEAIAFEQWLAEFPEPSFTANGKSIQWENNAEPFIKGTELMVPLKKIVESMGGTVIHEFDSPDDIAYIMGNRFLLVDVVQMGFMVANLITLEEGFTIDEAQVFHLENVAIENDDIFFPFSYFCEIYGIGFTITGDVIDLDTH